MLKHLIVLSALAVSSVAVAHADPISGFFSANGTDMFNSSTITFTPNGAPGNPNNSIVTGGLGGTFASYLADGDLVTFLPGALPYHNGVNTPPNPPYPNGVPLFSVTGGGETFTFMMTEYDAQFINDNSTGCHTADPAMGFPTCLDVTGDGIFVGSGAFAGTSGPAVFEFTSQYVPGQSLASITSFSSSSSATPPSEVPEPASLALFGTGLLGVVGLARRKFNI